MSIFDIITNERIETITTKIGSGILSGNPYFLFANDNLHTIAGKVDNAHLIYNADTKQFGTHWTFENFRYNY